MHFTEDFPEVRKDFLSYEAFLNLAKPVSQTVLTLTPSTCGKKKCQLQPRLGLSANGIDFSLHGEINMKNKRKFAFKIFCGKFGQSPCFRFDSSRHVHWNKEDGQGLTKRPVPGPHFHKVSPDGFLRAYQTRELEEESTVEVILSDITEGGRHFFSESKLEVPPPGVKIRYHSDDLLPSPEDPLEGAIFR